jgi:pyrophosphatase PpaX
VKSTQAIIFDLDGTLLDVRKGFYWQFQELAKIYGEQPISKALIDSAAHGTTEQIVRRLITNTSVPLEEVLSTHRELRLEAYNRHLQLYEGVIELLEELAEQGIKLAALTSGNFMTVSCLDRTQIRRYFQLIVTADHVTRFKPHPEGLLTILRDLNVTPDRAIMVGDTEADILTGKSIGVKKTIGVLHGFGKKTKLEDANADHIVDNFRSFSELLS